MNKRLKTLVLSALLGLGIASSASMTAFAAIGDDYVLNNAVEGYYTSLDAKAGVDGRGMWSADTYKIFNEANGMINITDDLCMPGAWINPKDNLALALKNFVLAEKSLVFMDTDSSCPKEAVKSYDADTYFIYKEVDGWVNITKTEGQPGAWVPADAGKIVVTPVPAKEEAPAPKTFVLKNTTNVFMNAKNALENVDAVKEYSNDKEYFIYKTDEKTGMVNITTNEGTPGAWIDPSRIEAAPAKEEVLDTTTEPAPAKEETIAAPEVETEENGVYTITENTERFVDTDGKEAADGKEYAPGTYYVYKADNGYINITTKKGEPGAWVKAPAKKN